MKPVAVKSFFFVCLTVLTNLHEVQAQLRYVSDTYDFNNAIGLRIGGTSGLTFKHRISQKNAVELILGTYPYSYGLTALYERYMPSSIEGLYLYGGAGAHLARPYKRGWGHYENERYYYRPYQANGPVFGVNVIGGIEYKIPSVPLALSLDIKPFAEHYRAYGPYFSLDPGLGIKFTF